MDRASSGAHAADGMEQTWRRRRLRGLPGVTRARAGGGAGARPPTWGGGPDPSAADLAAVPAATAVGRQFPPVAATVARSAPGGLLRPQRPVYHRSARWLRR